jgi:membrane-bound lytic murein transglycosylase A
MFATAAVVASTADANSPPKPRPSPGMKSSLSYKPVPFAELPAWDEDDHAAAFKTFLKSCERVLAATRDRAATDKALPPSAALVAACTAASGQPKPVTKAGAKAFFEQHFTAHAVSHSGPQGLLTGYYEPLLEGSRTAQGPYQTPVYKRPSDLVNLVDETQRATTAMAFTHARKTDKGTEPFPTRAQIEQGALKDRSLELVYLTDPVEVFFLQVQGSGRVKLPDGSVMRIHYDGKNGHPYSSIGRYLIEKGLLAADKVSLGGLKQWLKADPERAKQVMWQNAS